MKKLLTLICFLCIFCNVASAFADDRTKPYLWYDAALTGVALSGALGFQLIEQKPRFSGDNAFDLSIRDAVKADDPALAATVSDVGFYGLMAFSVAGTGTWALLEGHGYETYLRNLETLALVGFSSIALAKVSGRLRPKCVDEIDCDEAVSFPSGHTALAFAGAGMLVYDFWYLNTSSNSTINTVVPIVGLALASVTGFGRLSADRHYATDVFVGAALGLGIGLGFPLLRYHVPQVEVAIGPGNIGFKFDY